jgi:hypothetical protein
MYDMKSTACGTSIFRLFRVILHGALPFATSSRLFSTALRETRSQRCSGAGFLGYLVKNWIE